MNQNKYILTKDYLKSSTGIAFDYANGFQLSNCFNYDGVTFKTNKTGNGNRNLITDGEVDEFLYFTTGYGDYGAVWRYDDTTNTLIQIQKLGQSNCASIAIDKIRKKVWYGSYSSGVIMEYDYSDIFYSGGTTATLTNRTTADGLVATKMGYGPSGDGMVYHNDILYYTNYSGYQNHIRRWNTVTLADEGNVVMQNRGSGLGNYRGGLILDEDNDRIFNYALYGKGTSFSVLNNLSDLTGQTLTVVGMARGGLSYNYHRIAAYKQATPNKLFIGWNTYLISSYVDIDNVLSAATATSSINPESISKHKNIGEESTIHNQEKYGDGSSYCGNRIKLKNSRNNKNYYVPGRYVYINHMTHHIDFDNGKLINWGKGYYGYFDNWINPLTGYVSRKHTYFDDYQINTHNPYYGKTELLPIYGSQANGTNPYIINTGKTYHITTQYESHAVFDFGNTIPYSFTTGFTATFGDFNNFQITDEINIDISSYIDIQDSGITYSNSTIYKSVDDDGYIYWNLSSNIEQDSWYEIDFKLEFNEGKHKENPYFYWMLGGYNLMNEFFKTYDGKMYIKSTPTILNNRLYFKSENNYKLSNLSLKKVEKTLIDEIKIDNLIDNIFYISGSTLEIKVNGENFDLNSTNHKMETPAEDIEIQINMTSTDDRFVGTYIESDDIVEVTTYSYNKLGMTTEGNILIKLNDNDSNIDIYKKI